VFSSVLVGIRMMYQKREENRKGKEQGKQKRRNRNDENAYP
jgi:hypothetical protein